MSHDQIELSNHSVATVAGGLQATGPVAGGATGATPIVLSALAAGPLVALRFEPGWPTAWRSAIGLALCVVVTVWWIVRRDRWAVAIRDFFAAGRTAGATR